MFKRWLILILCLAATACATFPGGLPLGSPISDVGRVIGSPTGEYNLPGGGRRLEFAQGQFGRQTYMLDFDASGRLVVSEQVLTEANFAKITPGMARDEVLMRLGRPVNVLTVPRQKLRVWSYRFFRGDCIWFQISISDAGFVSEASMGTDPACDGPNGRD